ncbi:hypothetical protein ILUMI_04183 [Ignelater luminosus]|uniref:Uncharacterized protein n=1 Tax=Ignelater luminosus TaxID=2038154 RepID=A0A8K0DF80_IGNLU|nr:hypothetical protein ILUMI_04183 [Ignelater luminosus]
MQNKVRFTENTLKAKGVFVRKAISFVFEQSRNSKKLSSSESLNLDNIGNKHFRFNFNVIKSVNHRRDDIINYRNCQKRKFLKKKLKIKALFFRRARLIHSNLKNNFKFQFEIETSADGSGEA